MSSILQHSLKLYVKQYSEKKHNLLEGISILKNSFKLSAGGSGL
jgi:hypothetical protein